MPHWRHPETATEPGRPVTFHFAGEQGQHPLRLDLELELDDSHPQRPKIRLADRGPAARLEIVPSERPGRYRVTLVVPANRNADDDELTFELQDAGSMRIPACRIVLRRCGCAIGTALIERDAEAVAIRPETRAALLWYGWRRYRELAGLKRFTSGKSGSDVLVFRPRLVEPGPDAPDGSLVSGAISQAWGSCLLVKTGETSKIGEEWARFQTFLADRLHPFMSRSEAFLQVQLAEAVREDPHEAGERRAQTKAGPADDARARAADDTGQATLIGSFLGGDLLRAESLEQLVHAAADVGRCTAAIEKLFAVAGTWYAGSTVRPLQDWSKIFQFDEQGRLRLFGRYDLAEESDREKFRRPLSWDIPFVQREHLRDHLLGKGDSRDGLLYRLMQWRSRYSLIHGDLHTRNALVGEENVWLLDFGNTGVAPTLFDFAKLEVYLRAWCLRMSHCGRNFEEAAHRLEMLLLDHLTGSEASLEPVRDLAGPLGADADELLKIALCICTARREALPYMLGSPDCRDYLAVLYLTVLDSLRFAGNDPELTENFRLLVILAWVLEDVLSRMAGMQPYVRNRMAFEPRRLVTRAWLADPGGPGRVEYVMASGADREALAPLAATRGVIQNDSHHLDVYDHTLLVLAYVERLLAAPLEGLLDPAALDERVRADLDRQGIRLPGFARPADPGERPDPRLSDDDLHEVRAGLAGVLTDEARSALKWAALFHDVGKPATRCINLMGKQQRPAVQFLGHEVYGLQLVRDHLKLLFEDAAPARAAVEYLILEHHDHHNLVNRYAEDSKRLSLLRKGLAALELPAGEASYLQPFLDVETSAHASWFPLLVLHGYADALACRGPAATLSPVRVAEIDLLLLALFARYPAIRQRQRLEQESAELTRGLERELGLNGRDVGRIKRRLAEWYRQERPRRLAEGRAGPSREEANACAREFAEELGILLKR